MGMVGSAPMAASPRYSMDQWPGYAHERMRLVRFLAERRVPNPVVLTGDIHSNWVNDLRVDDRKPDTPVVATEFVGTSISSGGNGRATSPGPGRAAGRQPVRPVPQRPARLRPLHRDAQDVAERLPGGRGRHQAGGPNRHPRLVRGRGRRGGREAGLRTPPAQLDQGETVPAPHGSLRKPDVRVASLQYYGFVNRNPDDSGDHTSGPARSQESSSQRPFRASGAGTDYSMPYFRSFWRSVARWIPSIWAAAARFWRHCSKTARRTGGSASSRNRS